MSVKLYLSIKSKKYAPDTTIANSAIVGEYEVSLRADTPESCLASAAYDTILRYYQVENGQDFNVTVRDAAGGIVLDTELPAYGAMAGYGLSANRIAESA